MVGKLITFEGGDFTGKSTQIKLLSQKLRSKNIRHIITREPGGTIFGENIREFLLEHKDSIANETKLLLFNAVRSEHISKKILPALNQGIHVICDRFLTSSLVYQGILEGIGIDKVLKIHSTLFPHCMPDAVILLDLAAEDIYERMESNLFYGLNAYDSTELSEIRNIRQGFLDIAQQDKQRYKIIDASKPISEVSNDIFSTIIDII